MIKTGNIEATALARFFSAGVLKEMAAYGFSPMLARLIRESNLPINSDSCHPIREVFDTAFSLLKKRNNRHEYIYKSALAQKILLGTHSLRTASMLSEFRVGSCKADVVILNGTGTVYEIKSERDKLTRLTSQLDAYSQVFSKVNVIIGENHIHSVENSVPKYVGILVLTDRYQICTLREAIDDPARTDPGAIFDAITLLEAKMILQAVDIDVPNVPNTLRYRLWRELFATLKPEFAHRAMVDTLKKTRNLLPLQSLLKDLPESLYAASLILRLCRRDRNRLVEALKTPIQQSLQWG